MKGDRVEVLVDAGTGAVERFEISATKAGRRIEITTGRGVVEVAEMTRTGRTVRSGPDGYVDAMEIPSLDHRSLSSEVEICRHTASQVTHCRDG